MNLLRTITGEKGGLHDACTFADHVELQPGEDFHEASPTLERFYSAKSEAARSQKDLRAHGEVMGSQAAQAWQALHMPCFNRAHVKHDL